MNAKMMEEKRYEGQKNLKEKKEMQAEVHKYEETIKHFTF